MRGFRANDKMSAKEPVSVVEGKAGIPFPAFCQKAIPRSCRF